MNNVQRIKRNARNNRYNKKRRKENPEATRKHDRAYYQANSWMFAPGRHAVEMREVIFVLTKIKLKRGMSLGDLYDVMVSVIRKKPILSSKKFPFGKPDAVNSKIEWKFGFDRLRGCQFVWNVLNGFNCKVRWAPSCDEFEKCIQGRKNSSRLFKSYRDFVIWKYGVDSDRQQHPYRKWVKKY